MLNYNLNDYWAHGDPLHTLGFPTGGVKPTVGSMTTTSFPSGGTKPAISIGGVTGIINDFGSGDVTGGISGIGNIIGGLVGVPVLGDLLGGALGALGIGPEDWASVKARADEGSRNMIAHAEAYINSFGNDYARGLSKAYSYVQAEIARLTYYFNKYKSANSKNSIKVQLNALNGFLSKLLPASKKSFVSSPITVNPRNLGLTRPAGGVPFDFSVIPSQIQSYSFALKQQSTTTKPVVSTTVTTSSPKGTGSKESKSDFELKWWHALLGLVPALIYKGYQWIKKRK